MNKTLLGSALFSLALIAPLCAEHYQVYLLGGQSNGNGRADAAQLVAPLNAAQTDVRFYWHRTQAADNVGWLLEDQWIDLAPGSGHGTGEPVYEKEFGTEVSFGRAMADAKPTENIAIIKYTHGGTTLDSSWSATGTQYTTFVPTVQAALSALTTAGHTYALRGMLWVQGETDSNDATGSDNYQTNLTNLVTRVRTDLNSGQTFPFVLSTLSNSQYADIATVGSGPYKVRQAQETVAAADPTVGIVITDGYSVRSDVIHFDHTALVTLGENLATQMLALEATRLIHYWPFDGDADDAAGTHDGTAVGDASYTTGSAGKFGEAASLDGAGDYIDIGESSLPASDFTLTAWIYRETAGEYMYVAGTQNSGNNGAFLRAEIATGATTTNNSLLANLLPPASSQRVWGGTIPLNTWTHVAMTVSSTAGLEIFINGTSAGTDTTALGHTVFNNFRIGARPDVDSLYFDGLIDDVAIFDGVLTSTQLDNVIASGAVNFDVNPNAAALIHHWKLDGDATDSVGSADGTAQGEAGYALGQFGQAVSLDGVDDYISTATAGDAVLPSTDYTLMAWVFWDGANGSRGYIAGGQNSGTDGEVFTMGKDTNGTDRILFLNLLPNGGQGNSVAESPDSTISTGTWQHVAYTVDSNNGTTLYLNGSPVGTNPTRTTHTASTTVFNIGNNPQTGTQNPFDGLIDDVAVFSGVLDITQINNARNDGAENFNADLTPPTIVAKVPHGVSGVYPGSNLVATFSEDVVLKAGGTITITDTDDGSGTVVINLPDPAQVTVSGSELIINPSGSLDFGTNFEVVISEGAIEDDAGTPNGFPGTSGGQWTFSTAAQDLTAPEITLKSPLDNATDVSRATSIVATFDDTVLVGTGDITLKDLDDGSTTQVIAVTDTSQVSISGSVLTIDPSTPLAADRNYAVQIADGAVKNYSDVDFAGIPSTDVITWNFQTLATSPNVIFILSDDQGWYDYGFMQRPGVEKAAIDLNPSIPQVAKTPAIDRLADEGLAFIHGYSAPVCRPALVSIITGTYLQQHWVTGNDLVNFRGAGNTRMDDSTVEARMQVLNPLPRTLFNELGYTSFQTGKWWEGHHNNGGFTHGDTVNSTAAGTAPPQWSGGSIPSYGRARHGDWGLMTGRVDYVNDIPAPAHPIPYANTVKTVTDFINAQVTADQPFFLWYAPFLPHDPFDPPAGLVAEYTALGLNSTDAKYYANIERFDGGVGAILDHLDAKGIADNTIIIMICDNGRALDKTTEGKLTSYDSGVRSPIIVRWPDRIKPGGAIEPQIIRTPVNMVDMVPTVHHALGLPVFTEMRGIDLLDPAAVAARDTVCGSDHDVEILTLSDPTESLESRFAVRSGWKLILSTNGDKELYHLYNGSSPVDPHETNNLAASNPQLVGELTMEIVNWYAEPDNYDSWIGDPALEMNPADRGFTLDPDGDGLPNGIEAWFGTDPRAFSAGLENLSTDGTTTTFTHPRNLNPPSDLVGSYEWSPNLVDWYVGNGVDGPSSGLTMSISAVPDGSHTTVTATSSASVSSLFIRALATQN